MAFATPVRREVMRERSSLLVSAISTMERQIDQTLLRERLVAALSAAFGATALVLAAIGLYGILAYAVARRTNEIGIRMALGATRSGVVWMVLREALALAACGVVAGLPVAVSLGQTAKGLLYGVAAFDPATFAGASLLLALFAALAAAVPGRRAGSLDPMAALRSE
jgi:ABC-type antimicrobial peptide transport system permease subunit